MQSRCWQVLGSIWGSTGKEFDSKFTQVVGRINYFLVVRLKISVSCWLLAAEPSQLLEATCSSLRHEMFLKASKRETDSILKGATILHNKSTSSCACNHTFPITFALFCWSEASHQSTYTQGGGTSHGHEYIYTYIYIYIHIYLYTETYKHVYVHAYLAIYIILYIY